jgi:excisionase family DNA binding protein
MTDEMTIAEAAASLGVSVDTVRRRIKQGVFESRTDPAGRRMVFMQGTATSSQVVQAESERLQQELDHARELLSEVRRQREELAAQVEAQRSQLLAATRMLEENAEERAELRGLLADALRAAGLAHAEARTGGT